MGFLYSQLFVKPAYPTQSCEGMTIIVTGSNVGLGKEAARHFARLGAAKVILAVRNLEAGELAKKDIEETSKCDSKTIEVWKLDLASYETVKAFADRVSKLDRIDAVVENAGIAVDTISMAEGHERTITINVISTFLLALLLLPKLKAVAKQHSIQPRLTIVSSEVHGWTSFQQKSEPKIFEALDSPTKKDMGDRYQLSKLLEVLVVRHIAPQLQSSGVILNMLNPGLCHSELGRDAGLFLSVLKFFLARTTEVGSRTLVASALAGKESHGNYMHDGLVDDAQLSAFASSDEGAKVGEKVWTELSQILEQIQPGVTKSLQN